MNAEELGFFNRQLAGMLRAGIPLEGSLRKLCETLPHSQMRGELQALEADLAKGTPLPEAVKKRNLPEMYVRMLAAGAATGDLPGVLIQFADYSEQRHSLSRRLRGMMTYPLLVLGMCLVIAILLAIFFQWLGAANADVLAEIGSGSGLRSTGAQAVLLWLIPSVIGILFVGFLLLAYVPFVRRKWQWRLPGLRETCLAQLAAMLHLQVRAGIPLGEALKTVEVLEQGSAVAEEVGAWREALARGGSGIPQQPLRNGSVPALFRWMVRQSGEDLADGLGYTARFYADRSEYRSEIFVYAALPISMLFLGLVLVMEFVPVFMVLIRMMDWLGGPWEP